MAFVDDLERLKQRVDVWNAWRKKEPWVRPDLSYANLSEIDLSRANLREANLSGAKMYRANLGGANLFRADLTEADLSEADFYQADLTKANLSETNLRGADLTEANLSEANFYEADLTEANLSEANLRGADLSKADLSEADLSNANLKLANLVGARLDLANLTNAKLWETQRSGWSIKGIICQQAFWERGGKEPTEYGEGEFERIFAEKPRIVLRYPGGMSSVDLLALPLVVERLQAEHPGSILQLQSVQNDAGGASVTITVENLAGHSAEAFGQELVRIQAKLECIVDERDRLQQRLDSIVSSGIARIAEFLALPRQEIHVHRPSGLTAIKGPTMSRDTYNITGQAGAVGSGASAHGNTFQQIQGGSIDLPKLAEELGRLRTAMKSEATGAREQDKAIGAVADAEEAAAKGDGPAALQFLKGAGKWTLGIAEKIGVSLATEALKKAI